MQRQVEQLIITYLRGRQVKSGNLYTNDNDPLTLYSYGSHFPLAHLANDGTYHVNMAPTSVTTTRHRNMLLNQLTLAEHKIERHNTTEQMRQAIEENN